MDPEDREIVDVCALCGGAVSPGSERAFGFGAGNWLCWGCATSRGGRYDARHDVWELAPDLSGIPDEAYGASPHEMERRSGR